jgi:hypothetical protein
VPSKALLDDYVSKGFSPQNVETLLLNMQKQDPSNPFSQVTDATYAVTPAATTQSQERPKAAIKYLQSKAGTGNGISVMIGACLATLIAVAVVSHRRRTVHRRWRNSKVGNIEPVPLWEGESVVGESYFLESSQLVQNISAWTANREAYDDMEIEFHSVSKRRGEDDPLFQSPFLHGDDTSGWIVPR